MKYNHHVVLVGFRTTIILVGFFIIIQKGTSIFNMVSDFQHGSGISTNSVQMVFVASKIDTLSLLRYLIFYQSDQLVSYFIANLENSWDFREENKTKQNKQTPTPLHQMHVFEDLSSCPYTSWAGHF